MHWQVTRSTVDSILNHGMTTSPNQDQDTTRAYFLNPKNLRAGSAMKGISSILHINILTRLEMYNAR